MSRLLEVADLCSRTLSDPANRLRKTRKKKSSAVPLFRSGHMSAICARLSTGKVGVQRGRKTAGCPSFLPTAVGTASPPPSADGESPSEVQRKTSRPERANPPAAVRAPRWVGAEKEPLRQGEHAYAVRMPRSPGAEKGAARTERSAYAPRMHRTAGAEKPCRRFVHRHIKAKPRFPSVFFFICGGANRSCDRLRGAHRPDGFRCPT